MKTNKDILRHIEQMHDPVLEYIKQTKIPYVVIFQELIELITNKNGSIDDLFPSDLTCSFDQGFVVYYREQVTSEMIQLLHNFFRNTCCNIENIVLITVPVVGVKRYYQEYCQLNETRGFNVIELPFVFWDKWYIVPDLGPTATLPKRASIQALFSYYGGSYELNPPERTLLTLYASQYSNIANIDTAFSPSDWNNVENFLEYLTYFCDEPAIDEYKNIYNTVVKKSEFCINKLIESKSFVYNEKFNRTGPQWDIDSVSFFALIRESYNTQPFCSLSEKTMRAFFHGQAPIPLSGKHTISDFEDLGFKINKSFIDYSYLNEDNLFYRLKKLKIELDKYKTVPLDTLHSLWLDNYDMFKYNSDHLQNTYYTDIIFPRLDAYFK